MIETKKKTFAEQGVQFLHEQYCVTPEIPEVDDVLYALRLVDRDEQYHFCAGNSETYIHNCHLAASAVALEVLCVCREEARTGSGKRYRMFDLDKARHVVAEAIVALTPEDGKDRQGCVNALYALGRIVWVVVEADDLPHSRWIDVQTVTFPERRTDPTVVFRDATLKVNGCPVTTARGSYIAFSTGEAAGKWYNTRVKTGGPRD